LGLWVIIRWLGNFKRKKAGPFTQQLPEVKEPTGSPLLPSSVGFKHSTAACPIIGGISDVIMILNHYNSQSCTQTSSLQFKPWDAQGFLWATRVFAVTNAHHTAPLA